MWCIHSMKYYSAIKRNEIFLVDFFNLIFILYWGRVDFQCCVNFRCTEKWFSYTYTYIHFFRFFSHIGHYRVLGLHCCAQAFSNCVKRGLLFIVMCGLLTAVASLVLEHWLQAHGLQQLWLVGSRVQAQQLWCTGLAAPRHVGSSRTRAQTCVPCIGRRIL